MKFLALIVFIFVAELANGISFSRVVGKTALNLRVSSRHFSKHQGLVLGLSSHYDYFPPQDNFVPEEFPALRKVGYRDLAATVNHLSTFAHVADLSKGSSFNRQIKTAFHTAKSIVINCEGIDPKSFKANLSVKPGKVTNFELTYLFQQSIQGVFANKITWIKGPSHFGWQEELTNQSKIEAWWKGRESARPWCHRIIQKKLEKYFRI